MAIHAPRLPAVLLALLLGSCQSADRLLYEPKPEDPMDGHVGSLAEAGINVDMDWGPKQDLLLGRYQKEMAEKAKLQNQLEEQIAANRNLQAQVLDEKKAAQEERQKRLQAEAEVELLRQKRREHEARILSLSIEKAKLEQLSLQARIDQLKAALATPAEASAEPAATPPGGN